MITELLMLAVPKRSMKSIPLSPVLPVPIALPLFWTVLFASVNPVTVVPRMPSSPPFWMSIRVRLMPPAFDKRIPGPVVFWIVPPVPGVPVLVTVKVVAAPVPLRTMPLVPPLDETLVRLTVLPVVPLRFTAVPVPEVTEASLTLTPLTAPPLRPVVAPELMLRPRTTLLPPTVTVPFNVGRVPASVGLVSSVPLGGVCTPSTVSKAPDDPWPMRCSLVSKVSPVA